MEILKLIPETARRLIPEEHDDEGRPVSNGSSHVSEQERLPHSPAALAWLEAAARLPGKSLHTGIALWCAAGLMRSASIPLSNVCAHRFGPRPQCQVPRLGLAGKGWLDCRRTQAWPLSGCDDPTSGALEVSDRHERVARGCRIGRSLVATAASLICMSCVMILKGGARNGVCLAAMSRRSQWRSTDCATCRRFEARSANLAIDTMGWGEIKRLVGRVVTTGSEARTRFAHEVRTLPNASRMST